MAPLWGGRALLDEAIEEAVSKAQAARLRVDKQKRLPQAKVMDRSRAEAMAADLDSYDSRIVAGRLME